MTFWKLSHLKYSLSNLIWGHQQTLIFLINWLINWWINERFRALFRGKSPADGLRRHRRARPLRGLRQTFPRRRPVSPIIPHSNTIEMIKYTIRFNSIQLIISNIYKSIDRIKFKYSKKLKFRKEMFDNLLQLIQLKLNNSKMSTYLSNWVGIQLTITINNWQ